MRQTLTRLRAHAGLWTLTALLAAATVFVAAAAGPTVRAIEDDALRRLVAEAPRTARDITLFESADSPPTPAGRVRDDAAALLPPEVAEVVEVGWGIQHTEIVRAGTAGTTGHAASLNGDGVTAELSDAMPLASLHHQTDLPAEVTVVDGAAPTTDPAATVLEVMASAQVAQDLGLRVGEVYHLLPGVAARAPFPAEEALGPVLAIEVTGVFEPRDAASPVWEYDPFLLRSAPIYWILPDGSNTPLLRATLVTDQGGIDAIRDLGLASNLALTDAARFRLDEERLDADRATGIRDAVAAMLTDHRLSRYPWLETDLIDLIDQFRGEAAATRAVAAVIAYGLLGTGVGILFLAARITVDRRRAELSLLRARGGAGSAVVGRFLAEAALVVLPAAAAGWLAHLPLPGRPDPALLPGVGAAPLLVAAAALLAVPVAVALDHRRPLGTDVGGLGESRRAAAAPVRLTAELLVLLLAGLGVVLLHGRGLDQAGVDPYLSAVPVLLGAGAGLLALRLYPWPLRVLGAVAVRGRGAVGFLGLARAGRAAPVTAVPLVVLVVAVAVGGFAGGVRTSVDDARDAATVLAVGADARVAAPTLTEATAAAVAEVPGVTEVAAVRRDGYLRVDGRALQNTAVVTVDAPAYQRILAAIGVPARLPEAVVSATAGAEPVPILAPAELAARGGELTLDLDGIRRPARVVGDVADLPGADHGRSWVLVPRQILPEPGPIDELLIAGPDADPDRLRTAASGGDPAAATLTTRAGYRAELESSGFNDGLTLMFAAGTVGAALGALLSMGLALVVHGAARRRTLALLRTMGLSPGHARALSLVELVPMAILAVAVGAAVGLVLPLLLGPALGLTRFTAGTPVGVGLDARTVAVLALLPAALVVGGALVEVAVGRRSGPAGVLRVE